MSQDDYPHLTQEEKKILFNQGTEPPFSGEYNNHFSAGVFVCRACKSPLYESKTKFDSSCGWPSFDDEIPRSIKRKPDLSHGRNRIEICCSKCDGHLGHVFMGEQITKKNIRHCVNSLSIQFKEYKHLTEAVFGAGCFWNVEKVFQELKGVYMTQVGYMGGRTERPSYLDVCRGDTNHIEVVHLFYDEKTISYSDLLEVFWNNHDPTQLNRQGNDIGTQYRSSIFYYNLEQKKIAKKSMKNYQSKTSDTIVTEIISSDKFYRAEEYHQDYFNKNGLGGCLI